MKLLLNFDSMLTHIRKSNHGVRAFSSEPISVQDGLSLSPADMNQLNKRNMPISSHMLSDEMLSPGHEGSNPDVPFIRSRGVDFSEVYVNERNSRSKIKNVLK